MFKKEIADCFRKNEAELVKIITNFNKAGYVFGNQNRNTIRVVPFQDIDINIKSFRPPKLINRVIYGYFRKSKAERSFQYAKKLEKLGIGTPRPLGYFERNDKWGLTESYYVSEHLSVDLTYRELVEQPGFTDHEEILRGFVRFTHNLHKNNILFKDHSPGNTLIIKNGDHYHYALVDLNRMDFKELSFKERIQNFSRLTPKKEMVEVMSDEYAKITGKSYLVVFEEMWSVTSKFQKKFFRKKRFKKKLSLLKGE